MTIDRNIYREISCYERHQLIPFSNKSSGAITTVSYKLVFQKEKPCKLSDYLREGIINMLFSGFLVFYLLLTSILYPHK